MGSREGPRARVWAPSPERIRRGAAFLLSNCCFYICCMENNRLARITSTICLRGKKFPAGVIVRVWTISGRVMIQPFHLSDDLHKVLWYTIPEIHLRHVELLKDWECGLIDLGFL